MFRTRQSKQPNRVLARVQPSAALIAAEAALFDFMPLPEVIECDPAEGWALWNAAIQGKSAAEADTVLMGLWPA